ncbi:MAG: hypothetical protein AMJ79_11620 [Phycisphaerae bacterium SM23_30]|nr:MAG: hypothetical protein AMJ79_11620 [Phycisphaerae bacterium SM23_30]
MSNKKVLLAVYNIIFSLQKIYKYITECLTYSIDFCSGKGYTQFNCWGCENKINLIKRKRFVKCPKCWCWNMHPIWGNQGINFGSFSKKFFVLYLVFLSLIFLFGLGVYCLARVLY